jgi:hypothetical protein
MHSRMQTRTSIALLSATIKAARCWLHAHRSVPCTGYAHVSRLPTPNIPLMAGWDSHHQPTSPYLIPLMHFTPSNPTPTCLPHHPFRLHSLHRTLGLSPFADFEVCCRYPSATHPITLTLIHPRFNPFRCLPPSASLPLPSVKTFRVGLPCATMYHQYRASP